MRLKSIAEHHRTVNLADYLGKTAGNYDGTNGVTLAIEDALTGASNTTLEIPPGSYLLDETLDIPAAHSRNIILKPLGEVVFLHPYTAVAMQFDCQSLWLSGGTVTPTAIADEDAYPSASDQRLTKISAGAGGFSGYLVGDVVHVEEDLADASGAYCGEYARVIATDSSTYITLGRKLYYGYTTPANIRVRRIASTAPRLTVLPGITFRTSDDETSALASRTYAIQVRAAIDPRISVEFDSVYSTSIRMTGVYMGRVDYRGRNLHVDYTLATDATGVGVELYGSCYGTRVSADVDRGGNAVIFGVGSSYSGSFSANGAPMDCQIERVRARNMVRAGINCAWAVRPKFHDVQVSASAETAGSDGAEIDFGVNISAVDPWFGKLVVDGAQSAVGFRDNKGIGGTYVIEELYHRVVAQPSGVNSPILRTSAAQTVGNVNVEVHSGYSLTPGSYPIERKSADAYGITARFRNFTFANCTALARSASTRPDKYHIGAGCVYDPGTGEGTREGIIDVTDTNSLDITIDDLTVIKNAASFPNGLLRGVNGLTQATKINRIVCDTGVLLPKSTADATTSAHNITRLLPFGEQVYTDAAMAGNLAVTAGYGLLLLDPNGADRTVTLPGPATSSGLKVTVMHTGAANTLQVAGTINPAAPAAIAAAGAQTWQSDGTTWYLVG